MLRPTGHSKRHCIRIKQEKRATDHFPRRIWVQKSATKHWRDDQAVRRGKIRQWYLSQRRALLDDVKGNNFELGKALRREVDESVARLSVVSRITRWELQKAKALKYGQGALDQHRIDRDALERPQRSQVTLLEVRTNDDEALEWGATKTVRIKERWREMKSILETINYASGILMVVLRADHDWRDGCSCKCKWN